MGNFHEESARQAKVSALVKVFLRTPLGTVGNVANLDGRGWMQAAAIAGVNLPSPITRAAVVTELAALCSAASFICAECDGEFSDRLPIVDPEEQWRIAESEQRKFCTELCSSNHGERMYCS